MRPSRASFDRTNAIVATGVALTALFVYIRTLPPTLSFWDCGEFIAASYILGIPHPPGTPTYIMFGRLATLLPLFTDICARVNFYSALCSSLATMFSYLFGVRIMRHWFTDQKSAYSRLLIYAGAAAGALFLAFGRTQWNNSIEAEVYGMAMMLVFAIAWLTMVYLEKRGTVMGNKVIILVAYLGYLGIGVHMSTFLVLPISMVVFVLRKNTPWKHWFLIGAFFVIELYLIFALSSRAGEVPYYFPIFLAGLFYLFYMLTFERIVWQLLAALGGFVLACVPAIATLAGWDSSVFGVVGLVGFAGLIGLGLYLVVDHVKKTRAGEEPAQGSMVAGVFIIAAGLMTAIAQAGFDNGPDGYHTFLFFTVVLALSIGGLVWRYINLPVLVALVGPAMIMLGVREFFWGTLMSVGVVLIMGLAFKMSGWRTALLILIMSVAGYSTHLLAPIRSAQKPAINMNNPSESLDATVNFFERKQYGSQPMSERMFQRRGEWLNQFGSHRRMGFWYFFEEQYGLSGRSFVIFLLLGVFGAWEACRRRPEAGVYLSLMMLVGSVGLVLYMNFADGSRQTAYDAWLEVRDRDYFFTPAFMFFGLAIGLGISATIQLIRDLTRSFHKIPRRVILTSSLVLFLLPVYTVKGNFHYSDRSDDYIPYDYAWNILQSCDPNAILFTYGDNDTFPLWCLQEVYGIRTDVKPICCSLANGTWYIKLVRDHMKVDVGWDDAQLAELRPYRTQDGRAFRIQDQVVDAVTSRNIGKRPINFSLLANSSARKLYGVRVDSLMEMSGLVYRLTTTSNSGDVRVDGDANMDLLMTSDSLKYRGWTNPDMFQAETTERSVAGVADRFMSLAEAFLRQGRVAEAAQTMEFVVDSVYRSDDAILALASVLAEHRDTVGLVGVAAKYPEVDSLEMVTLLARAHAKGETPERGKEILEELLRAYPNYRQGLDELMQMYIVDRNVEAMVRLLRTWVNINPGDADVREALRQLEAQLEARSQQSGDSL